MVLLMAVSVNQKRKLVDILIQCCLCFEDLFTHTHFKALLGSGAKLTGIQLIRQGGQQTAERSPRLATEVTAPVANSSNSGKSALDRQTFPMGYLHRSNCTAFQFVPLGQCSIRLPINGRFIHLNQ